jgi:putative membrane protein
MVATHLVAQTSPWQFQAHPEVWVLVLGVAAAYWYMVTAIGPQAVAFGEPVITRTQKRSFFAALALLWIGSDWPVHDIGETYLYSAHMLQHMIFTYFMPPLFLMAIPEWMARLLIGRGRAHQVARWLTLPVVAGVAFNLWTMVTHIPLVVNTSVGPSLGAGFLHYALHFVLVMVSLMMWMPLCGPLKEFHRGSGGQMIYLFAMSVVPTVPAGWLTFADKAVYKAYDSPIRIFGWSVTSDQQVAGLIMKVGGSVFLWILITRLFFKRFMTKSDIEESQRFRKMADMRQPDGTLTYGQVTRAFAATDPATEGSSI